jgi:serine/threonine protein kinase
MGKYLLAQPLTRAAIAARKEGSELPAGILGAGGFGQVVSAIDTDTGEHVCIKLALKQAHTSEELREVILQDCLHHDNVVCIKDFLFDTIVPNPAYGGPVVADLLGRQQIGVVMEMIGGGELYAEVVKQEGLAEAVARTYFRQILLAVAYCHARGVAHRDIKLENLLLSADKTICKVADFGMAKNLTDPRSQSCVTPDMLVRAALARKEDFALELRQLLKQVGASGFSLDWEYFYGNNQSNAAALWGFIKNATTGVKIYPWITNGDGIDWSDCGPIHRCGEDFAYCCDYAPRCQVHES